MQYPYKDNIEFVSAPRKGFNQKTKSKNHPITNINSGTMPINISVNGYFLNTTTPSNTSSVTLLLGCTFPNNICLDSSLSIFF